MTALGGKRTFPAPVTCPNRFLDPDRQSSWLGVLEGLVSCREGRTLFLERREA
jgi:hypothetical protein